MYSNGLNTVSVAIMYFAAAVSLPASLFASLLALPEHPANAAAIARAARTRGQMPRGRIPGRVRTQSQMYANDGVSAFGNISSRDLARLRRGR